MWMSKHSPIEIGFPSINGQVTGQSVFCIFYRLQNLARVFCKIIRACFPANKIVPVAYVAPLSERFPASPRGGRQPARFSQAITSIFLSTSPARGTTANVTENAVHFLATFVTTRHSVQKHAVFLCKMRLLPRRICTNTLKMISLPGANCPAFFCALRVRTGASFVRRAFLHRRCHTSRISSCAHCGARPTCSTLVLYWLPSR